MSQVPTVGQEVTIQPAQPLEAQLEAKAPVAAPAAPAKAETGLEIKPEPEKAPAQKWEETGDQFVDGLAKAFSDKGGDLKEFSALLDDTATSGKLSEQARQTVAKVFGDGMAPALVAAIEQKAAEHLVWAENERKGIFATAGGEEKFVAMQEWAAQNVDAGTRELLSKALNKGGDGARAAVRHIQAIMKEKGATVAGVNYSDSNIPGGAPAKPLTRSEYIAAREQAERRGNVKEIEALDARRRASLAQERKGA